jgi:hypothetical protein
MAAVRVIRDSSEDEMVLAFLSAEVGSGRFGDRARSLLGDLELVRNPDLTDAVANQRRSALAQYRGWRRNNLLFLGFPRDVRWKLVEVTIGELGGFRYAREPTWIALSGGSLLVRDGAANAARKPLDETKERIRAVEREIRRGATLPLMIVTAEGEDQIQILPPVRAPALAADSFGCVLAAPLVRTGGCLARARTARTIPGTAVHVLSALLNNSSTLPVITSHSRTTVQL